MNRNRELEALYQRLDQVRMSERDRIRARAHLERAEAVASLLIGGARLVKGLFRKLVIRPIRRLAAAG